jgi:fatty-acid desaturase
MAFHLRTLRFPSYGYKIDNKLVIPTHSTLLKEFLGNVNLFRSRKNWLPALSWLATLSCGVPLLLFLLFYLSWPLFFAGFVYSMVVLGTHGTVWYHRYCTHRAFQFTHPIYRFVVRNLVVKMIIEELYVVSHHVHHLMSEKPGDPYNVNGGWLYCFLADANHQPISSQLSKQDYGRLVAQLTHTGVRINTYEQYLYWGSICNPLTTVSHFLLNWCFWYAAFYLVGGHGLALALFGSCAVWGIGIRTFNYDGHGGGKDKRKQGSDFHQADHSINQFWPGLVTGEWHNNHHLYPNSARAGFLRHQIDFAWWTIRVLKFFGGASHIRDSRAHFLENVYRPYLERSKVPTTSAQILGLPTTLTHFP